MRLLPIIPYMHLDPFLGRVRMRRVGLDWASRLARAMFEPASNITPTGAHQAGIRQETFHMESGRMVYPEL